LQAELGGNEQKNKDVDGADEEGEEEDPFKMLLYPSGSYCLNLTFLNMYLLFWNFEYLNNSFYFTNCFAKSITKYFLQHLIVNSTKYLQI
jgi:hypothetical protein